MIYQACLVYLLHLSSVNCQGPNNPGFTVAGEEQLRKKILNGYSPKIRPDGVAVVNLVFNLLTVNDLQTRTQMFSVSGYFTMVWTDSRLAWNTSEHSDIGFVFSDETEVWRPALVVKNAVDDISVIANEDVPFRITSEGQIFWNPPGIYQTNCDIDTTYYPFDTQECSVLVQSWGYNLKELNLTKYGSGVDTSEFQENGEWDLLNATSKRAEKENEADRNTYATVSFDFTLKRRTTYYGLNIILPVIVLSILSALVFILPADSGEKMGYSLTVLLALAVFLTLISDRMPTTSKTTSYMALYLSAVLCLNGISVLMTICILSLCFREEPVPEWLITFTKSVLMPMVCARGCRKNVVSTQTSGSDLMEDIATAKKNGEQAQTDAAIWYGKEGAPPAVVRPERVTGEVTWKDISRCVDAFCFRIYIITIAAVTIVFFSILGLNA